MTQQAYSTSRAWSWRHAIALSDLPALTRHMLLTLSLKMDETGGSCYPPISELVTMTGLDKKTVLKHLDVAEQRGWLEISQHGFRGQKWKRNEYFAKWPGRDVAGNLIDSAQPDSDEGGGNAPPPSETEKAVEMASEGGGNGSIKVVEQLHQDKNLPTNIPSNIPERERASEPAEGEDDRRAESGDGAKIRRAALKAFDRWYRSWPAKDSSHDTAQEAWFALNDDQRAACIDRTPDYIDWVGGAKKISTWAAVYLRERRWEMLPPKVSSMAPTEVVKPFGKAGMAYRFWIMAQPERPHQAPPPMVQRIIDEGGERAIDEIIHRKSAYSWPRLAELDKKIVEHQPIRVPADMAALGSHFQPAEIDGPVGQAWKQAFRENRLPWLPVEPKFAYFPPLQADGADLNGAVAAAIEAFKRKVDGDADAA